MIPMINQGPYGMGMVRWNGNVHSFETMDQYGGWNIIHQSVQFPADLYEILDWATKQKRRQERLAELRKKYPTLDQALLHAEVLEELLQSECAT